MQGWRNFLRAHAEIVSKAFRVPKSTSPCLLAIPAFDRIAWIYNRHLNSNSGVPRNFVRGEGVQQIQLKTDDRENGDLGALAL